MTSEQQRKLAEAQIALRAELIKKRRERIIATLEANRVVRANSTETKEKK